MPYLTENTNPLSRSVVEGIYRIDLNGICTDANEACLRLLGYSSFSELLGKNMHQLIHHHHSDGTLYDEAECRVYLANKLKQTTHVDDEVFWRKDGSCFPVEYWSRPEMRDGEFVGCVVNFIDITSRVIAERQLARSEQRLRFAMEASNVCLWEWNLVTDQIIWSQQLFDLLGYEPEVFQPSKQSFIELTHPSDRQNIIEMIERAYASLCTNHHFEFRVLAANGKYLWLHCRGRIERDTDDEPLHITSLVIDITATRQALEELAATQQRLELGVSLAGLGIADIDYATDLVHLSADAARLYGLSDAAISVSREVLHKTIHPDDYNTLMSSIDHFANGEDGPEMDCKHRIVLPDGSIRWLHVRKRPYEFGPNVSHRRAILAARDITFEQEATDRIERSAQKATAASKAKSFFLASMSHEIRTPMSAILGYTELMLGDSATTPEQLEQLEIVHRNGSHLLSVINDLLDLSKVESGKLDVFSERVEPLKIVEDIRSIMEVRAAEKDIALEVVYAGAIPQKIKSDGKRLKQILFNLVGNAIKFTPEGKVTIRVRSSVRNGKSSMLKPNDTITFEVQDTGIGMSDELMQELFEPFAQGHKDIGRNYGGTGLGLAISRRLAILMGGDIEVESSLGEGSVFRLRLPIGEVDGSPTLEPASTLEQLKPIVNSATQPMLDCNILVVDDRRDVRLLTTTVLHKQGATTEQAEDGEKAVEKVQRSLQNDRPYDLIVLDMQMPKLDGYRTARQLRTMGYEGPIIALTAEAMQGDLERCLEAGCNCYLSKPVNIPEFTRITLEHIQQHRAKLALDTPMKVQPRHGY